MNDDTKTADNNPNFYRVMAQMYAAYLDHSDGSFNSSNQFQLALSRTQEASTLASLAKAIGSLTHEGQRAVVEFITAFAGSGSQVVRYSEKAIGLVNKVKILFWKLFQGFSIVGGTLTSNLYTNH